MTLQLDTGGHLRHLLTLRGLPRALLVELLDRAEHYSLTGDRPVPNYGRLGGATVVNLMCEPSTRTRASFELAARRLGATVLDFDVSNSSQSKGETLLDTVFTLEAMRCDVFVIRTGERGVLDLLAQRVGPRVAIINAGESNRSHPTQGLLDVLTIRRYHPDTSRLTVAIVGDVRHSRVARSTVDALQVLGVGELRLCAPPAMLPDADELPGARLLTDVDTAVAGADVVMALRIQRERMRSEEMPQPQDYFMRYGLTRARIAKASPRVMLMHPGPVNRDLEIASELIEDPRSVIREQVANGVAVRMAVLERLWHGLQRDELLSPATR
jgi:aspartate carbamoyltransferase catalytic subunit